MKWMRVWIVLAAVLALGACGGSGGTGDGANFDASSCAYDISDFCNGANASTVASYWLCDDGNTVYEFEIYEDGTGISTRAGPFTWEQTGCDEIVIEASGGSSTIADITGSAESGIGSFTQKSESHAACMLVSYGSSSSPSENEEPTEVYDYFENEPYIVYVDTSLYLGDYSRDASTDTCSNNVFPDTLSDTMSITSLSEDLITFTSDAFWATFIKDDEYPSFNGADRLQWWYSSGNVMCTTSLGSLAGSSGYTDIWILVCGFIGNPPCGVTYTRTNPSAVKDIGGTDEALIQAAASEAMSRLKNDLTGKL